MQIEIEKLLLGSNDTTTVFTAMEAGTDKVLGMWSDNEPTPEFINRAYEEGRIEGNP